MSRTCPFSAISPSNTVWSNTGVIVKLSAATVSGELVGIGYVTVTVEGLGTFTIYGNQLNAKVSELAASWNANDEAQQNVLNFFRGNAD